MLRASLVHAERGEGLVVVSLWYWRGAAGTVPYSTYIQCADLSAVGRCTSWQLPGRPGSPRSLGSARIDHAAAG